MSEGDGDIELGKLTATSMAFAASVAKGRDRLSQRDAFVAAMTSFDRQARLQIESDVSVISEAVYLSHLRCQVMPWSAVEIAVLRTVIQTIHDKLEAAGLKPRLPERVWFVKTSGREEGDAAYTRNTDTVVLPAAKLEKLSGGDALHPTDPAGAVEAVTTHELYHVQSKTDPARRSRLYPIVGYRLLDQPVELPNTPAPQGGSWPEWKITNPDAPRLDVAIELRRDTEPDSPGRWMTPVLLARRPYCGGQFFDYLEWVFMVLDPGVDGLLSALGPDGGPILVESGEVMADYQRAVGRNFDQEIFHPDEILAQNFVLAVNEPNLELLNRLRTEMS